MAKRPGANQQQNELVFGLTYRPTPNAQGQVHRFLAQKAAELYKDAPSKPMTPEPGDNQAKVIP